MRSKPAKIDIRKKGAQGLQDAKNYNAHCSHKNKTALLLGTGNMCYVKILSSLPVVLTNNRIARMQDYWITM